MAKAALRIAAGAVEHGCCQGAKLIDAVQPGGKGQATAFTGIGRLGGIDDRQRRGSAAARAR